MAQLGTKLRRIGRLDGSTAGGLAHWCPACDEMHAFALDGKNASGAGWTWNGDDKNPTFTPSMKITGKQTVKVDGKWTGDWVRDANGNAIDYCCHYILTAGVINYCGDCTHAMKGQSVPLPDLPARLRDAALQ